MYSCQGAQHSAARALSAASSPHRAPAAPGAGPPSAPGCTTGVRGWESSHVPSPQENTNTKHPCKEAPSLKSNARACPQGCRGPRCVWHRTGQWLPVALLPAAGRLPGRRSRGAQRHTFASRSPSALGTCRVSLCAASVLFPSRKTTAPSSIPSCKRNRAKHPGDSAEGQKYLEADPAPAHANKSSATAFSGSRIRGPEGAAKIFPSSTLRGRSSNSPRDLWKEA